MASDWVDWHRRYDDAGSMQARRLAAVVGLLARGFDEAPPGPIRVLSLCAGEARDLHQALDGHPRSGDVTGLAVEADPELAARAAANLASIGCGIEVRAADAGDPTTFRSAVPADVVLLCGIFGNIAVAHIAATIDATPALCRPGATVLWTRHRRHPDITPWIRQRFHDAACPATGYESPGPDGFAVGRQRCSGAATPELGPGRLFTFTTTASAWGSHPGAGRRPSAS